MLDFLVPRIFLRNFCLSLPYLYTHIVPRSSPDRAIVTVIIIKLQPSRVGFCVVL